MPDTPTSNVYVLAAVLLEAERLGHIQPLAVHYGGGRPSVPSRKSFTMSPELVAAMERARA